MRKNLITAKTQKSTQGQTKMAKPLHGIMNKQSLFRGAAPQGEFTNISKTATTNMAINPAQFYSPELTPETWLLPKSRLEILKWCRIYFNLDPYIQSILTMHAQYPISTFRLQYKDKDTEDFFNRKLFEDCQIDWVSFLERLSLSYYVYGEAICWGDWNSVKGTWNDIILIDPALIDYQEDALTGKSVMSLIPTQELKQLVAQALRDGSTNLPADYIACVQDNKQIPLDTEGVEPNYLTGRKYVPPTAFIFARLLSPGSTRGVPIIQQLFKCVTGDTKVALLDGTNPTIKELAESGRKDFWVYGADKDGNIVPAKAECAAYIKDEETVEVLLDNGSKIRCTKDHPFFLRDMTRVEAKDLKPGDALMPLYRKEVQMGKYSKNKSKYEKVYNPADETWKLTHVISALQENRDQFKLTGSRVIHHKDFNSKNNTPENLVVLSREEHAKIHSANQSPEWIKHISHLAAEKRMSDDSFSKKMKEHWANPEYKKQVITARKKTYANLSKEYKQEKTIKIKAGLDAHWTPRKKKLAELIREKSINFFNTNGRKPSFSELAPLCNISVGTLTNYGREFGYDYLGINDYAGYKNHKVVSVTYTGKVEPVYCVANAGVNHNFMIAFDDGSGVLSGNTLIYADKIRLAQVAAADSFYNPIQLWSIGSYTGDPKTSIIPTEADLQQYRDMIEQATMTPPFSIYVPPFVKYEALGVQGKLLSVYEDLGYVENCIFVGLGVNKNLVLGSGPSFSSGKQISLYRLIKMYKSFRLKLEAFFKKYIILPIAKAADIRDEHSNYIIPEIKWSESLQPEQDKDLFDSLFKLYDKGLVSTQTLMEHFMIPLDMKLEQQRMEAEKRTIFDKGTDRLGAKVLREDLQNLDKSKMGGGSSSGPKSEPLAGGSSGGLGGGEEKLDLGKPYPGSAGSDKSSLPPPISGGAGVDKGEPTPSNETPTTPAEPAV